jgi:hypothetical protein
VVNFFAMAVAQLTSRESLPDIEGNILDALIVELGAYHLLDRGYLDFGRWPSIHQAYGFFVTRAKDNTKFNRRYSHPVDRIKVFLGASENAVKTQNWIAVCTCVLIAVVQKPLMPPHNRYEVLQVISLSM